MGQSTHYRTFVVVKIRCYFTILVLWVLDWKYGCTDHGFGQTFMTKMAWMCHEEKYTQPKAWRCDELVCRCGLRCQLLFHREEKLLEHRQSTHGNVDKATERNRIGYGYNHQFWCNFCGGMVWSGRSGLKAQLYRFDHIEEHRLSIAHWGVAGNEYYDH